MMLLYRVSLVAAFVALSACNDSSATRVFGPDGAAEDASTATDAQMDAAISEDAASEEDAETNACIPATEVCNDMDDDCDGMVDEGLRIACLVDADGDHHAISKDQTQLCPDTTRPAYGNCPAGYQTAQSPGLADCDDTNPALHGNVRIRRDFDSDGFCTSLTTMPCGPSTPAAPYRREEQCAQALDCNDENPHAGMSCVLQGGFVTTSRRHLCGAGSGPTATTLLTAASACPQGFSPAYFSTVNSAPMSVSCTSASASSSGVQITQTCLDPFGESTCYAVADCYAN